MTPEHTDIFIAGGGIAGLVAALGFAKRGLTVVLADPGPLPSGVNTSDLRSTAYLQPARALLEEIGVWSSLDTYATPLEVLRVIDCAGDPPEARTTRAFEAADLGAPAFGWNLPNSLTRNVLYEAAVSHPLIDLRFGIGFQALLARDLEAIVTLSDKSRLKARLAVAADGRASPLREAAGIGTDTVRYGQKALAFSVTHTTPHDDISTELYHEGGAFVLVPLPDQNGLSASAVVWMNDGPEALRLADLSESEFAAAATLRSTGVLGPLTLASDRQVWPVITQRAHHLTARRVAIIAEAAHVLPPIGAQGLNTSLMDVRRLLDLASNTPETVGSADTLTRFARERETDIAARTRVIDLYNRLCRSGAPPMQAMRSLGLRLAHDVKPLRQTLMRAGLGT